MSPSSPSRNSSLLPSSELEIISTIFEDVEWVSYPKKAVSPSMFKDSGMSVLKLLDDLALSFCSSIKASYSFKSTIRSLSRAKSAVISTGNP